MSSLARLARAELERLPRQALGKHSRIKPAVWRVEAPGGAVVVKDVRHAPAALRWIARWLLERERRVLERLVGLEGVPQLIGPIDRDAIAITFLPGATLDEPTFRERPRELALQILDLTDRMHAAGVYHMDLHQRRNLLVDEAGRIAIVDFGASVAPGPILKALLGGWFRLSDRNAAYKFLARFAPEELTEAEARSLLRERAVRRLWLFKQPSWRESDAARQKLR